MGNGLFAPDGVDIAALIDQHLGPRLLPASLVIYTQGQRTAGQLTGGREQVPGPAIPARGFWKDYSPRTIDGQVVLNGDRKAFILGGSNPEVPELPYNSSIAMEGQTMYVVRTERKDPARARIIYQCRDRRGPDGQ